jgi:hypothetical protein
MPNYKIINNFFNIIIFVLTVTTTTLGQTKDSLNVSICIPKLDTLDNHKVYTLLDKIPEYPGGEVLMVKYIQKNLIYPSCHEYMVGSIYLTFVIDTTGKIRNACVFNTHKSNNEFSVIEIQVLKLINEMPTWTPGQNHGENVYARVNLPIKICPK